MNIRYELVSGGCVVCGFQALKDALTELESCKRMGVNAYIVDTETGEEIDSSDEPKELKGITR